MTNNLTSFIRFTHMNENLLVELVPFSKVSKLNYLSKCCTADFVCKLHD